MTMVSKYSMLFYGGPDGYLNIRAQISVSNAAGNPLAYIRFKDPGMQFEPDTDNEGIITMHLPSTMFQPSSMPSGTRSATFTIRLNVRSCTLEFIRSSGAHPWQREPGSDRRFPVGHDMVGAQGLEPWTR